MIGEFSRSRGVPGTVGLPVTIGLRGAPARKLAGREREQEIAALQQVYFEF